VAQVPVSITVEVQGETEDEARAAAVAEGEGKPLGEWEMEHVEPLSIYGVTAQEADRMDAEHE
jgi:hypothetical protein